MIAFRVNATGGPMSLILGGFVGGSGFGNGSHFRRYARQ